MLISFIFKLIDTKINVHYFIYVNINTLQIQTPNINKSDQIIVFTMSEFDMKKSFLLCIKLLIKFKLKEIK